MSVMRQPERNPHPDRTSERGPRRLRLTPAEHPARQHPKPLGVSNWDDSGDVIGLEVADARHHVHVPGVTGSGKSTGWPITCSPKRKPGAEWRCWTAKVTSPATCWNGSRRAAGTG